MLEVVEPLERKIRRLVREIERMEQYNVIKEILNSNNAINPFERKDLQ